MRVCRSGENGAENNKAASGSMRSNSLRSHTHRQKVPNLTKGPLKKCTEHSQEYIVRGWMAVDFLDHELLYQDLSNEESKIF